MKLYVTIASCYQLYMRGLKEAGMVWMREPRYSHLQRDREFFHIMQKVEDGWYAGHATPTRIDDLLDQRPDLVVPINEIIMRAVAPADVVDAEAWCGVPENWAKLGGLHTSGPRVIWEKFSTTHYKRFLIEIDIVANTCRRLAPMVYDVDEFGNYRKDDGCGHSGAVCDRTDQIAEPFKDLGGNFTEAAFVERYRLVHGAGVF